MISRIELKKIAEEKDIPFSNLLSGVVCEAIIDIIYNSGYAKELYLCNGSEFCEETYKDQCSNTIRLEYVKNIDEKLSMLYLRDIYKEIISKAALEAINIDGNVTDAEIQLKISVDNMYVPITLKVQKSKKDSLEGKEESLKLTYFEGRSVTYLSNPKEEIIINYFVEILEKLELINEMDNYYEAYSILSQYPINGRKVREGLKAELQKRNIAMKPDRAEIMYGYANYAYMKKKWKVELRQKKKSESEWKDVIECLYKFLKPIWTSIETDIVFLGDWMPQLRRYLD